jgi:LacI family transcriptional regulator, repressor for deo operon, udp, cdd, tsx, nupC, and nupG
MLYIQGFIRRGRCERKARKRREPHAILELQAPMRRGRCLQAMELRYSTASDYNHGMAKSKSAKGKQARRGAASQRRYNITEVAVAAKVSVATVSRTLAMPDVVAPETRQRVHAAIRRMGYTPNMQARSLRTARTNMIVALVPDISNSFFAEVIRGIEQVAHRNGYSVLLGDTQYNRDREQTYADLVGARQADGLITLLPHIPRVVSAKRAPLVNACEYVHDPSITSVYADNVGGAREAVEYLLTLGHRSIAFVSGPMNSPISVDRDHGYEAALADADIKRNPKLTIDGDFSAEAGIRAAESLFARGERFTALFCSNDEMAFGALQAIKSRGLRVPEDISVVGFDDIRFARYCDPPLTTIAQPMGDLGRESMNMLIEILNGTDVPPRKRMLPTHLIVRGSTAPCRKA